MGSTTTIGPVTAHDDGTVIFRWSDGGITIHHKDGTRTEMPNTKADEMDPDLFVAWLAEMKSAGLARSDAECARLLGISANSVLAMKERGADKRTALACRALLHRLEPYGG